MENTDVSLNSAISGTKEELNLIESALLQAKKVFEIEAQAILDLQNRLDSQFVLALNLITKCTGKVILTGIGKSGHIARKIASTLCSTGTPALYLHPSESAHGDLGLISSQDIIIAISYSGNSSELRPVLEYSARKGVPVIALTENYNSQLATAACCRINIGVKEEACPLNLAPTASSTATLAMGDALAMAVVVARGFKAENFAEYHPGGTLGFRLLKRVRDLMHTGSAVPFVKEETPLLEVLELMTDREVRGLAVVIGDDGFLKGVITDGDVRRALRTQFDLKGAKAIEIMNSNPKYISQDTLIEKSIHMMETNGVTSLVVVTSENSEFLTPLGAVNIHDLLLRRTI